MKMHICFSVKKNCWNLKALCNGTCYGCGCCADDKRERYENRIKYLTEELEHEKKFDNWLDDDPEVKALQEENLKISISQIKSQLNYYSKKIRQLKQEERHDQNEMV